MLCPSSTTVGFLGLLLPYAKLQLAHLLIFRCSLHFPQLGGGVPKDTGSAAPFLILQGTW